MKLIIGLFSGVKRHNARRMLFKSILRALELFHSIEPLAQSIRENPKTAGIALSNSSEAKADPHAGKYVNMQGPRSLSESILVLGT